MSKLFLVIIAASRLLWPTVLGPEPENPYQLALRLAGDGKSSPRNYLLPLVGLQQQQAVYTRDTTQYERLGRYWEASATYASLADEVDSAARYYGRQPGYGSHPTTPTDLLLPAALQPAVAAILAQTQTKQLVLFNEEHTQPRGRWLVGSMLPALYRQGFRYLALEALNTDDSAGVRRRGYPLATSGFYVNEPHFGNLIRQARALGFQVVGYDAYSAERERDQARNLLALTLRPNPQARVLVLAGHGHIDEHATGPNKHMAQWVHELSGIDPLTIDQTQLARHRLMGGGRPPAGAYVVAAAQAHLPVFAIQADIYVLNALALDQTGNSFGQRAARTSRLAIPPDSLRTGRPHIVLVYAQAERQAHANAEPVAVRCLWPGQLAPALSLLPGRYVVELRDAPGHLSWQQRLRVL